jgi:ferredoxin
MKDESVAEQEEDLEEWAESEPFDLLRVPVIGPFLQWRHSRTILGIPLLAVSLVMILQGLVGPSLSPKNLATVLTWVHFRGALVLAILCAGNLFCLACPFMLARNAMRRFVRPRFNWPRPLRNKWIPVILFALILFCYELFALWSSPWLTAWMIIGYFLLVLVVDGLFKNASFCKYVCPIGNFNFIASTAAPLEVAVRDHAVCSGCTTKDCIRGSRKKELASPGAKLMPPSDLITQRGCELALFQPAKVGNMDCTLCLDCVHACPENNVGLLGRIPAAELMTDPHRSGIGFFSRRKDIAALAIVFCFGALMNAFGMVSPVYVVEAWLGQMLHIRQEAPILGLLFFAFLVIEPALLLGGAAWLTCTWAGVKKGWLAVAVRYTYCIVPLGFGMWLAHYGYHFFTGLFTIVPVAQNAFAELGWPVLGDPHWTLVGLPKTVVEPLEFGFLLLGLGGSLGIAWRLAQDDADERALRAFVPWAAVCAILFAASVWLILQPMDMRATMMAG